MTAHPIRILSSQTFLIESEIDHDEAIIVASEPTHLRILSEDLVMLNVSPTDAPVSADDNSFAAREYEPIVISLARAEQLSIKRHSENDNPTFVSVSAIKFVLG